MDQLKTSLRVSINAQMAMRRAECDHLLVEFQTQETQLRAKLLVNHIEVCSGCKLMIANGREHFIQSAQRFASVKPCKAEKGGGAAIATQACQKNVDRDQVFLPGASAVSELPALIGSP